MLIFSNLLIKKLKIFLNIKKISNILLNMYVIVVKGYI
jgi:hypothetical protein